MSPGLLQLAAVWSDRQTHAASTVGAECCGKADHRSQTSPTHHTDEELNSRWPPWYTKCCQAKYLAIWPTIFISPQKFLLAPSGPLRGESALSLVFRVVLVTDVLLQLDHVSGTTYLPVCETRKSAAQKTTENIHVSDGLRRIVTFLIIAPYKYSYLLTCLLIKVIKNSVCNQRYASKYIKLTMQPHTFIRSTKIVKAGFYNIIIQSTYLWDNNLRWAYICIKSSLPHKAHHILYLQTRSLMADNLITHRFLFFPFLSFDLFLQ